LSDIEAFDTTFRQLRVAHQFRDNLVGALNLLANDGHLIIHRGLAIVHGTLQAKSSVGDDAQGIFELVGDLCGKAAGGLQSFLAHGKFCGLSLGAFLALERSWTP